MIKLTRVLWGFSQLQATSTPQMIRRSREEMASSNHYVWAIRPFQSAIQMPVYRFEDAQLTGKHLELDQDIFNRPLRRDLIHRLLRYTERLYQKVTKPTMTMSEVSASGIKDHAQKGSGRARQGHRQKPGRKKGIKAHGVKARLLRIDMPRKVRLQALKSGISAALYDDRITIIDSEKMSVGKTKLMIAQLKAFEIQKERVLIVTGLNPDTEFQRALSNVQYAETCPCDRLNILKLLKNKRILITQEGVTGLTQFFSERTIAVRGIKQERPFEKTRRQIVDVVDEEPVYDPTKPLDLKFKVLQEYLNDFETLRKEGKLDEYLKDMPQTKQGGRINSV